MTKKIKILTIGDNPMAPSGVAIQTKNMIQGLLETGDYKFFSFAGALQHNNYDPFVTEEYGDDWVIQPVDGFGNDEQIRSIMRTYKPDILWFMTDPRFYEWLWNLENEIRPNMPMVYYHVWDNLPYPTFNKAFYDSNDCVVAISKLTEDIVKTVSPDVECLRIGHAVDTDVFCKEENTDMSTIAPNLPEDKFVFFWNNRNARRKQSGSLIWWFNEFLSKTDNKDALLVMHTEPFDPNGQDLVQIIEHLGLEGNVLLSTKKMPSEELAKFYNYADCTINISDAEGFGLSTLESLSCETPIIVTMTGGLQEQVTDGIEWFGIGLNPTSKSIIGSQQVPWIYEDRIDGDDLIEAMLEIYNMPKEKRLDMGKKGRNHVLQNYNLVDYHKNWDNFMKSLNERHGSWDSRKIYKNYKITEISNEA